MLCGKNTKKNRLFMEKNPLIYPESTQKNTHTFFANSFFFGGKFVMNSVERQQQLNGQISFSDAAGFFLNLGRFLKWLNG
jgi:hypothetical protein